jgi:uncharacterized protein YkwD
VKKFNSIFRFLLVIVLVFALTACNKSDNMSNIYPANNNEASTNSDATATNANTEAVLKETTNNTIPSDPVDAPNESIDPTNSTESEAAVHEHSYTETTIVATCITDGGVIHICECGDSYQSDITIAVGHKWEEWQIVKEPTTVKDGQAKRECSVCKETEAKVLHKIVENHIHEYKETITTNPTCTQEGVKTFTCSCGGEHTEKIPKIAHSYTKITVDATCTKRGYVQCKCSCGDSYIEKYIDTKEHDNISVIINPTCTTMGYTTHTCKNCGVVSKDAYQENIAHDYAAATCTDPKICKVCKASVGQSLGHSWKSATCTTPQLCSRCDATDGKALGHDYDTLICTAPATCKRCGMTADFTGHSWVAATCIAPKTCSVCKTTEGAALGHDYRSEVIDPTCTCAGKTTYTCSHVGCDAAYVSDRTQALGHSTAKAYTVNPTCGQRGYDRYECIRCDYYVNKNYTDPSGAHSYSMTSNTATCTSGGIKTYTCSACGNSYTEKVDALGSHDWTTMNLVKAANAYVDNTGGDKYSKYAEVNRYSDYNVKSCSNCYEIDMHSVCFASSASYDTNVMLSYVNSLRESVYGFDTHNLIADAELIRIAEIRAREIVENYSHNSPSGARPSNCGENIASNRACSVYADYMIWHDSEGHYLNMINATYKSFGYARYVVYNESDGRIYKYSVQIFR